MADYSKTHKRQQKHEAAVFPEHSRPICVVYYNILCILGFHYRALSLNSIWWGALCVTVRWPLMTCPLKCLQSSRRGFSSGLKLSRISHFPCQHPMKDGTAEAKSMIPHHKLLRLIPLYSSQETVYLSDQFVRSSLKTFLLCSTWTR